MVVDERFDQRLFREHVELLQVFLARRGEIVEGIQGALNAQRMPAQHLQDVSRLSRQFEDCFFTLAAITPRQSRLRGQLQASHWANGFRPRETPGNELIDPVQLMIRGFHFWGQTRWPGRNGRVRYGHTLFNLYVIRSLELLSMRLWDAGSDGAAHRLSQIQGLLDQLWQGTPPDQPVFLRDARWLIPLAQSPTTDELAPYFEVAKHVAESLSEEDRIEIQKAGVLTAGGHLRSQLRHYCIKNGVSLDENGLILSSRNSNALDFALTIQSLVPLLIAYEKAVQRGVRSNRLELAGVILQGISPDPELFINGLDLLTAYSMIETLFIETDPDGHVSYTPMGRRHLELLQVYRATIRRVSQLLREDLPNFKPMDGAYSPYGLIYGFSSNLMEHMALKSLDAGTSAHYSLEDAFSDGDADRGKLAWVNGWRKLPHINQEVQDLFEYPRQFAEAIFDRMEQALGTSISNAEGETAVHTGRMHILNGYGFEADTNASLISDLPVHYMQSSDNLITGAEKARPRNEFSLLRDRREGMFVVSYKTPGGWIAISKDLLTEVLGAGRDVKIVGLPGAAAAALRLTCPHLVATLPA